MKIKCEFAVLDVTRGRRALEKRMLASERIPVNIRGFISHVHGNDDGVSIEFGVDVVSVKLEDGS